MWTPYSENLKVRVFRGETLRRCWTPWDGSGRAGAEPCSRPCHCRRGWSGCGWERLWWFGGYGGVYSVPGDVLGKTPPLAPSYCRWLFSPSCCKWLCRLPKYPLQRPYSIQRVGSHRSHYHQAKHRQRPDFMKRVGSKAPVLQARCYCRSSYWFSPIWCWIWHTVWRNECSFAHRLRRRLGQLVRRGQPLESCER